MIDIDVLHIVGTRPNFVKLAPLYHALKKTKIKQKVLNTGQHDLYGMEASFLKLFDINVHDDVVRLDHTLGAGDAQQLAKFFIGIDVFLETHSVKLVIVYGDVNSAFAGALTAARRRVKVAHVEACLRTDNCTQPEEQNRRMIDIVSNYLFTPLERYVSYLECDRKIYFVGNILADAVLKWTKGMERNENHYLLTLHRREHLNREFMEPFLRKVGEVTKGTNVIFPTHPSTKSLFDRCNIELPSNFISCGPQSYTEFLQLMLNAKCIITDSGGVQVETTILKKPCVTVGEETPWEATWVMGTNVLCANIDWLGSYIKDSIIKTEIAKDIPLWDGKTAKRIVEHIKEIL